MKMESSTANQNKTQPVAQKLSDYREHYRTDAEAIVDPEALHPVRQASEARRLETLMRVLAMRPGERLLDIGCGSGWLASRCQEAGAQVWALDISMNGVAAAKRRYPQVAAFQVGDVYHLGFNEVFDAVVLSEVVEHLEDIDAALAEVVRVVRPGGRVLVSVPYRETIVDHLCIHCNTLTPANAHLHRFEKETLAGYFQNQEMTVRRTVLMTNKLLELAGFPYASRRWPYWLWRGSDRLFSGLVRKPAFLAMLATKAS
jgi:2-polyprenyl-3-methyl-5-hydroxy-6-metoxy-1,4-benzoquinol methylase